MRSYLLIIAIALLTIVSVQQNTKKLIFVQEVFRHGARYPIAYSSKDLSNLTSINILKGQLTNQGKSQHYLLGKKMYETYWQKLFGKMNKYKQEKFYFKSTDVNRTIESLQSHLLGLFENTEAESISESETQFSIPAWNDGTIVRNKGNLFERTPYFHPLPVHVQKGTSTPLTKGDILRTYDPQFCPKQNDWRQANKRDPFILNITQNRNFTKALNSLGQVLQQNVTFFDILRYYDNAECLSYLSKPALPIFTTKNDIANDLAKMFDLNQYIKFLYTQQQLRTTATAYFNQTVNHFKRVTANQDGVQWAFYSAHDTTVENILARLGLTSVKCIYENYLNGTKNSQYCVLEFPTFTSQVIFQVYMYSNKTYTFQILYNGNYKKIPFCMYQLQCNIEQFYKWYDSWKDQDWVKTCGVTNETAETYFSIIIIELGIIIIFSVGAILRYLNNKKQVNDNNPPEQIRQTLLSAQNQIA